MNERDKILELIDLSVGYKRQNKSIEVLCKICATAAKCEMIAVIGANGVGKSTLLRSIIGLQDHLSGSISLEGRSINSYSRNKLAHYFSYVSASATISSNLTVHELVSLGRFPHTNWIGRLQDSDNRIIDSSISSVGLSTFRNRKLNEMSDGERQRAMIARALAQDTQFIVLDEPTAYLDLPNKYELIYLLRRIVEKEKKTLIYTTHDLHIAIGESDKIWLLGGTELYEGAPEDLMREGRFAYLFNESKLEFADESGLYIYPAEIIGSLRLESSDQLKKLSLRALMRLKIEITGNANAPLLEATGDYNNPVWTLSIEGRKTVQFYSVYDLSFHLRQEVFNDHVS